MYLIFYLEVKDLLIPITLTTSLLPFPAVAVRLIISSCAGTKKIDVTSMDFLVLLVFGTLCMGLMMIMYRKNSELSEAIQRNEDRIKDFERSRNSVEDDSLIRKRLSNTESRVTFLEKLAKIHTADLAEVKTRGGPVEQSKVNTAASPTVTAEQMQVLSNQIIFVNDRVTKLDSSFDAVNNAQIYLASKAVMMENSNVCIFSNTDNCPPHLKKFATFGIIAHSGDNALPTGYYMGGSFNDNGWNWIHGSLCCGA